MISGQWVRTGSTAPPTTSAIGSGPRGFTVLELLLVLALIALLGTLSYGVSANMLKSRKASPQELFWQACEAARMDALKTGREVSLSFDDKAKAFVCDDGLTPPTVLAIPSAVPDTTVDFHAADPSVADQVLVGGTLVETQPLPNVTFFPDGTCSPFHVQFRERNGAHSVAIDPWTCALALPPVSPTAQ